MKNERVEIRYYFFSLANWTSFFGQLKKYADLTPTKISLSVFNQEPRMKENVTEKSPHVDKPIMATLGSPRLKPLNFVVEPTFVKSHDQLNPELLGKKANQIPKMCQAILPNSSLATKTIETITK